MDQHDYFFGWKRREIVSMKNTWEKSVRRLNAVILSFLLIANVMADGFPPYWSGGAGGAIHFQPVAWPADVDWIPYTAMSDSIEDPRVSDPSNGGTRPQNYVNVSSDCTDLTLPSVYYAYDAVNEVLFYRWRVSQRANTYATGPSAGPFSNSDPWNSALWTVFIDLDGDGYRDFAFHLDGSSGSPSTSVDLLVSIYSNTISQSLDYINDPNVFRVAHNPAAFVDDGTDAILSFQNSLTPTITWPNAPSVRIVVA